MSRLSCSVCFCSVKSRIWRIGKCVGEERRRSNSKAGLRELASKEQYSAAWDLHGFLTALSVSPSIHRSYVYLIVRRYECIVLCCAVVPAGVGSLQSWQHTTPGREFCVTKEVELMQMQCRQLRSRGRDRKRNTLIPPR